MPGVRVQANGRDVGASDSDGCIQLPPSRVEQCSLAVSEIPSALLPGQNGTLITEWKRPAIGMLDEQQDIPVNCLVWIYAVTEQVDEGDESDPMLQDPPSISLWVA
eukprot:2958829-Amphidinium_carterae.1